MKSSLVQVSDQPLLAASGPDRLGANGPPHQVELAPSVGETNSFSLPFPLEADLRALPSATLSLALIPLLLLLLLALRQQSRFQNWCRTSSEDVFGLFRSFRRRRHVIHDKPYLDRVLEAEFGRPRPPSSSLRSSSPHFTAEPPVMDESILPSPKEGRDLPS